MKKVYIAPILILMSGLSLTALAQNAAIESTVQATEYQLAYHDAAHPCISADQYADIQQRCAHNITMLGLENAGSQRSSVQLNWPLRAANGLNDCGYYIVSAYVDQDPASGSFKDWNCGSNTYDGHPGTDICTFPYPFYKMDNNEVEVIAAAAGTIIDKNDGAYDKNCVHNTSAPANYVVIQHSDGTYATYFHMKKNSITTKAVGQTVAVGEYLGVVGSSGDANGPHLHFEVRTANNAGAYKDPFAGTCNALNTNSWWASQKSYTETAILKTQVSAIDPVLTTCPTTETPHDDDCLVAGSTAKFYIFMRDETQGLNASLRLLDSAGQEVTSWAYTSATSHLASIVGWTVPVPSQLGTYTFQAVYNNISCSRTFQITSTACATTTAVASVSDLHQLDAYPNPATDKLTISGQGITNGDYTLTLRNVLGQTLLSDQIRIADGSMDRTLSLSAFPHGLYFLSIETEGSARVIKVEKN